MATKNGDDIQIDKGGFVRIHYVILEKLATAPLRGQQLRCVLFLLRQTYGFNKKADRISLGQWATGTGLRRQNVWREVKSLIDCNMVFVHSAGPKQPNTYGFNKHWEQWDFDAIVAKSVIADDYNSVIADDYNENGESVITGDYNGDQSVIADDYKSVITPHENTINNKNKSSSSVPADPTKNAAAAAKKSTPRIVSEFVQSYERIWGMLVASPYIGELIADWEQRVTLGAWEYGLKECAKRRNVGNMNYLARILERLERDGFQPNGPSTDTSTILDFAIGDIAP